MPGSSRARYAFLDWPGPLPFAHRGGAAGADENTMSSFGRAVGLGYRYLETDVNATADGVLLAFHDRTLDRVTDRTGRVASLSWREVREARIGGSGEPIPLLEDVLGAWPQARVNIDVKDAPAIDPLVDALRRTRALDRVCVGSFSDRRLAAVRAALGPQLCTSASPREVAALVACTYGYRRGSADLTLPGCVQVPSTAGPWRLLSGRFVATAHDLGLPVHVWTIDDPGEMLRLLHLGVDGIMTDDLLTLRRVLQERGDWHAPAGG